MIFIIVGFIALGAFALYDRTQLRYIKQLKKTVDEQNSAICEQQRVIDTLLDRQEAKK